FSTHILSDAERTCDRIGILKEGKLLVEDNIEDIKKRYTRHRILVEVDDTEKLMEKVKGLSQIKNMERRNNNGLVLEVSDILPVQIDIPRIIVEENLVLEKWEILEPSLEDIFLEVTNK
ncbi:MAG TPA: DUF4162 domain-containing protein, partial [bacterium]|nr:DUF4162 domain-containing protein [bacterium]